MQYKQGYRCVYSLNIHLVLVTKYRRKMINQSILKRLNEIFDSTCQKWEYELTEMKISPFCKNFVYRHII